jgi:polyphosphate kinase 2 (PPK2 family)
MKLAKIVKACRIDKPARFRLADHDPAETFGISTDSDSVKPILADGTAQLTEMQQRLYANGRWAVLIVLQGMDAAGKDGVIKHVMSGVNPQGCRVHAFKAPSGEELEHDFLWRAGQYLPHRHLQSLALRRSAGRARASGPARTAKAAAEDHRQKHLGAPL